MQPRADRPARFQWSGRWTVVLLFLAAGAAAWWYVRDEPRRLMESARALLVDHPTAAEKLLEESVAVAGGDYPEAQALRTEALARMHRWPEAIGCLHTITRMDRVDPQQLVRLAEYAAEQRQRVLADRVIDALSARTDLPAAALESLIPLKYRLFRFDEALEDCQRLESLRPQSPVCWEVRGFIAHDRDSLDVAIAAYRAALERSPMPDRVAVIQLRLATALTRTGKYDEAQTALQPLLTGDPQPAVRLAYAALLRELGNLAEAEEQVRLALKEGVTPEGRLLRGTLAWELGRAEAAAEDFAAVVARQPWNKEARHKLAQALVSLKRPAEAEQQIAEVRRLEDAEQELSRLERTLRANPDDRSAHARYGELLRLIGRFQD